MSQNKNVVLLNGRFPEFFEDGTRPVDIPECNPNNEKNWMGKTKHELEKKGFVVTCPIIPEVWEAPYSFWKKELDRIDISEETTLVGLSQGAGAITRYLVEEHKSVKKLILIAPMRIANEEGWKDFYDYDVPEDVNGLIEKGTVIFYDPDDYEDVITSVEICRNEFRAEVREVSGYGHFSFKIGIFPELLPEILSSY